MPSRDGGLADIILTPGDTLGVPSVRHCSSYSWAVRIGVQGQGK